MSSTIAPEVERRNGLIFLISVTLTYFAAPVTYVGIVQAALCDKLGASATVSNLPDSAFLIGSAAPLLLSWGNSSGPGARRSGPGSCVDGEYCSPWWESPWSSRWTIRFESKLSLDMG